MDPAWATTQARWVSQALTRRKAELAGQAGDPFAQFEGLMLTRRLWFRWTRAIYVWCLAVRRPRWPGAERLDLKRPALTAGLGRRFALSRHYESVLPAFASARCKTLAHQLKSAADAIVHRFSGLCWILHIGASRSEARRTEPQTRSSKPFSNDTRAAPPDTAAGACMLTDSALPKQRCARAAQNARTGSSGRGVVPALFERSNVTRRLSRPKMSC